MPSHPDRVRRNQPEVNARPIVYLDVPAPKVPSVTDRETGFRIRFLTRWEPARAHE